MINLDSNSLSMVKGILLRFIPNREVWVFGSRLNEKVKPHADLDLVIVGPEELDDDLLFKLKNEFEDSDLPIRVDIMDWHKISSDFQDIIKQRFEVFRGDGVGA